MCLTDCLLTITGDMATRMSLDMALAVKRHALLRRVTRAYTQCVVWKLVMCAVTEDADLVADIATAQCIPRVIFFILSSYNYMFWMTST